MVNADPLAGLYEDEQDNDPLAGLYEEEEEKPAKKKKPFLERLESGGEEAPSTSEIFQYTMTPATSMISGRTLGASEHIPFMKPHPERTGMTMLGEATGAMSPISLLHKGVSIPYKILSESAPILKQPAKIVGNWLASGTTGALYEGAKEAIQGKMPSVDDMLEHGAIWMALDASLGAAGSVGRFVKGLFNKAEQVKKPATAVLKDLTRQMNHEGVAYNEKIGEKALNILESPDFMKKGANGKTLPVKEITNEQVDALNNKVVELATPERPKAVDFNQSVKDASQSALESKLDNFHPQAEDSLQLGEQIQNDVVGNFEAEEAIYTPKYDEAERVATKSYVNPKTTNKTAVRALNQIRKLKTKPSGYATVEKALEDIIADTSDVISTVRGEAPHPAVQGSKLIELGRRLNKIIKYDIIGHDISGLLKPVNRAVKGDARKALSHDENALRLFNEAELDFARTAQRFGADSIHSIRGEKALEKIADKVTSASTLKELRDVLDPMQMRRVERAVLDKIAEMPHAKAVKEIRELRRQLSKDAQKVADEIVAMKSPFGSLQHRQALRDSIRKDITKSVENGERPKTALDLWRTKEGQKLVTEATNGLKNQKQVLNYLRDQSVNDYFAKAITPEGKIDFKEFNEMFRDKQAIEDLRTIGGESAVTFFRNLERMSKQLKRNVSMLERLPTTHQKSGKLVESPRGEEKLRKTSEKAQERLTSLEAREHPVLTKVNELLEHFPKEVQTALHVLGAVSYAPAWGTVVGSKAILNLMAKSPRFRKAVIDASKPRSSLGSLFSALSAMEGSLAIDKKDRQERNKLLSK